jgi:hypothetical protein
LCLCFFSVTASEWDSLQGITGLLNWYWSKRGLGEKFILWLNGLPFCSVTSREILFFPNTLICSSRLHKLCLLFVRAEDTDYRRRVCCLDTGNWGTANRSFHIASPLCLVLENFVITGSGLVDFWNLRNILSRWLAGPPPLAYYGSKPNLTLFSPPRLKYCNGLSKHWIAKRFELLASVYSRITIDIG